MAQLGKSPATAAAPLSMGKAMAWSFGSTFGTVGLGIGLSALGFLSSETRGLGFTGLGLIGLGVSLGPSIGYFYAGETTRGLVDFGIRTALYTAGGLMTWFGFQSVINDDEGAGVLVAGIATLSVAGIYAIYSCIDAGFAAKRTNAKRKAALAFSPTLSRGATGEAQYGLALAGRF